MFLPFCLRQIHLGAGPGPVAIDREVVYSDMTEPRMWKGSNRGLSGFGHTDWIPLH